jgi:hypothetical protein
VAIGGFHIYLAAWRVTTMKLAIRPAWEAPTELARRPTWEVVASRFALLR